MGTHPNAILMCVLTPDDLSRKTFRDIAEAQEAKIEDDTAELRVLDRFITHAKTGEQIPQTDFRMMIMEESYDADGYQISAPVGSIVVWEYVTYGYGDVVKWAVLDEQRAKLEEWAKAVCERHKCSYEIQMTANYW